MPKQKTLTAVIAVVVLTVLAIALVDCSRNDRMRPTAQPAPDTRAPAGNIGSGEPEAPLALPSGSSHCPFGDPVTMPGVDLGPTERIHRHDYDLLHSARRKTPLWVCEELTSADVAGHMSRKGLRFAADPALRLARAEPGDYTGVHARIGLDRGHMAPAADHEDTLEDLRETFYLSNVVPQDSTLNEGLWSRIEDCARREVPVSGREWIITGPIFGPANARTIGDGVAVPVRVWKVVILQHAGGEPVVWAVDVPNLPPVRGARPQDFAVTLEEIEAATHLNLAPALSSPHQLSLAAAPCR